jgi:hypothetical protein
VVSYLCVVRVVAQAEALDGDVAATRHSRLEHSAVTTAAELVLGHKARFQLLQREDF